MLGQLPPACVWMGQKTPAVPTGVFSSTNICWSAWRIHTLVEAVSTPADANLAISSASLCSPRFPRTHIIPPKKINPPDMIPTAIASPPDISVRNAADTRMPINMIVRPTSGSVDTSSVPHRRPLSQRR